MRTIRFVLCLFITIAFVASAKTHSHPGSQFGGTFIGAVVAEDGIIVGSDSRSTFLDANGQRMGYVEGMQKVYASNSTAVAVSGLTSVEGELFSTFVERNSFLLQRSADEVLFGFALWLPYQNSTGVMLLSAGFNQGHPMICGRTVSRPQACQDTGSISNKPSASLQAWSAALRAAPKASAAAAVLKQAIQQSAASDSSVGGPISIVQLRPGAPPVWLENPPHDNGWKTVCDLVKDSRAGHTRITPIASPQELEKYLLGVCPK